MMTRTSFERTFPNGARHEVYLLRNAWHIRRYRADGSMSEQVTGAWYTVRELCPWVPNIEPREAAHLAAAVEQAEGDWRDGRV